MRNHNYDDLRDNSSSSSDEKLVLRRKARIDQIDRLLGAPKSEANYLQITFSVADSHTSSLWRNETLLWSSLAERLTKHQRGAKQGSAWAPSTFERGQRKVSHALEAQVAVLDCDKGQLLADITGSIRKAGYAAAVVSSHSHMTTTLLVGLAKWESWLKSNPGGTPEVYMLADGYRAAVANGARIAAEDGRHTITCDSEGKHSIIIEHRPCPKWRVIIPVKNSWKKSSGTEAYGRGLKRFSSSLGIVADPSCMEPSRLFFDPRFTPGREPEATIIAGALADPWPKSECGSALATASPDRTSAADDVGLREFAASVRLYKRDQIAMLPADFASAVMAIPNNERFDTFPQFMKVLGGIAVETKKSEDGWALAARWIRTRENGNNDPEKSRQCWEGIQVTPREGDATGASIITLAKEYGWILQSKIHGGFGDLDLGVAFADQNLGVLLFVSASSEWLRWDVGVWTKIGSPEIESIAKSVARGAHEQASRQFRENPNDGSKAAVARAGRYIDSIDRARKIVEAGRSEPGMSVPSRADFDHDRMVLGVLNGAIDLRSGRFFHPEPESRISKRAAATFEAGASCPRFEEFLERIQPNPDVRDFLQRWAGYVLTGVVNELKWLFCYGTGANGKTAFVNILSMLLGDYVFHADSALLTRNKHENEAARQVAQLPGKRLISANETSRGDIFDDERMKRLVSQEPINARLLHREAFNFDPTGKLMLQGNHRPIVQDDSHGFWRRMLLVHFPIELREEEMVRDIDRFIFASEASGILNWTIEGCLRWQVLGLSPPICLEADKEEYKAESDTLGQWIEQCCERKNDVGVYLDVAFQNYVGHHKDQGLSPMTQPTFTRAMKSRGFPKIGSKGRPKLSGLLLRSHFQCDDDFANLSPSERRRRLL